MPREGSNYDYLALILIDIVLKNNENHYPRGFLKECKYTDREKKWLEILTDYLGAFSDNSDKNNFPLINT